MGKKELLAVFMMRSGLLTLLGLLQKPRLIIFNYHRIAPGPQGEMSDFDSHVYGPTAGEFEEQVAWISRHFEIAGEQDILEIAEGRSPLRGTKVAFTFDDGYKDNYQLAFPILKKYNAPAIFFISTALTDGRTVGWWDQVAYLLKKTTLGSVTLRGTTYDLTHQKALSEQSIKDIFVSTPRSEYDTLIDELAGALGGHPPSPGQQDEQLMNWSEIKEMSEAGYAIGSHGSTHRVLTTLNNDEVRSELDESKRILEERLGVEVRSLAYPVGREDTFDQEVQQTAKESGYRLGFSFNTGINSARIENPLNIRRVYPHHRPEWVAGVTVWPRLFMWDS